MLAVTQLLSNFTADVAPVASVPMANPFISPGAAAAAVSSPVEVVNDAVSNCNLPPASTDTMPRHSSLPSSPRWFGESTAASTSPMLIPSEPLRARAILFQVRYSCKHLSIAISIFLHATAATAVHSSP